MKNKKVEEKKYIKFSFFIIFTYFFLIPLQAKAYTSIMDAKDKAANSFISKYPIFLTNSKNMGYDIYSSCAITSVYYITYEATGDLVLDDSAQLQWGLALKATEIFQNHHLSKGLPQSVLDEFFNSAKSMFMANDDNYKNSVIIKCKNWVGNSLN